jgi:hypothetical protein
LINRAVLILTVDNRGACGQALDKPAGLDLPQALDD